MAARVFLIAEGLVSKLLIITNFEIFIKSKFMYGSVVRSALLPAWVCQLPLAVGLVSKLGASGWPTSTK